MPAATLEHSSKDGAPVFVSGGRRRNHAVRAVAATLGLLLAVWLAALAAGLIGFSALPELAFPGTGAHRTAPASPDQASQPRTQGNANVDASPIARRPTPVHNAASTAESSATPGVSRGGTGGGGADPASGPGGTSSTSPNPGGNSTQPQPATQGAGTPAQASSGHPPSFTPPASGEKSASPPRGNSANAPGRAVSADPPGNATRPHSG
jgi:hypothetical protein